jgi:Sensor N-terminal transmembrane domain
MALETDRTTASGGLLDGLARRTEGVAPDAIPARQTPGLTALFNRALDWGSTTAAARFLSKSLLRRILAANLFGLAVMIGGIHYLSQYHAWLIDAKRESLKVQGEMIAAAIASDARVETGASSLSRRRVLQVRAVDPARKSNANPEALEFADQDARAHL